MPKNLDVKNVKMATLLSKKQSKELLVISIPSVLLALQIVFPAKSMLPQEPLETVLVVMTDLDSRPVNVKNAPSLIVRDVKSTTQNVLNVTMDSVWTQPPELVTPAQPLLTARSVMLLTSKNVKLAKLDSLSKLPPIKHVLLAHRTVKTARITREKSSV